MKLVIAVFFLMAMVSSSFAEVIPFVNPEVQKKLDSQDSVLEVIYDFSRDGGAIGTIAMSAAALNNSLPDNAIITHCYYDVLETFTTASGDTGTIAINIPTDGDLQAATAVTGGTKYDAGLQECATKGDDPSDPSTFLKTTSSRVPSVVIAGQVVTAGKLKLFIKYNISL